MDNLTGSILLHQLIAVHARLPHFNSNQLKCQHSTMSVQMTQIALATLAHGTQTIKRAVVPLMPVISPLLTTAWNVEVEFVLMEPSIVGI